jgi:hypothetical protein
MKEESQGRTKQSVLYCRWVVTTCTTYWHIVTSIALVIRPESIFTCFIWFIAINSDCFLKHNRLLSVTEVLCVFCEVGTEFFKISFRWALSFRFVIVLPSGMISNKLQRTHICILQNLLFIRKVLGSNPWQGTDHPGSDVLISLRLILNGSVASIHNHPAMYNLMLCGFCSWCSVVIQQNALWELVTCEVQV